VIDRFCYIYREGGSKQKAGFGMVLSGAKFSPADF
jgi:hypothetical protein